jgi:hypothetical protein
LLVLLVGHRSLPVCPRLRFVVVGVREHFVCQTPGPRRESAIVNMFCG